MEELASAQARKGNPVTNETGGHGKALGWWRFLWHLGSSVMLYCMVVSMRACDANDAADKMAEYNRFHPYLCAWILGLNLTILAIIGIGRRQRWF